MVEAKTGVMRGVEEAKRYVETLLEEKLPKHLSYHNFQHTMEVYETVTLLAEMERVGKKNKELLQIAALFHDTGFTRKYKGHEEESAKIAREWMNAAGYGERETKTVERLIMATRMPQQPRDLLEKIICDADMWNIGTPRFFRRGYDFKAETEEERKKEGGRDAKLTKLEWDVGERDFLEVQRKNSPWTDAAKRAGMERGMELNARKLETMIEDQALDNLPRYVWQTDAVFEKLSKAKRR